MSRGYMRVSESVAEWFHQEVFAVLLGIVIGVAGTLAVEILCLR
jgi:hypothetical protein